MMMAPSVRVACLFNVCCRCTGGACWRAAPLVRGGEILFAPNRSATGIPRLMLQRVGRDKFLWYLLGQLSADLFNRWRFVSTLVCSCFLSVCSGHMSNSRSRSPVCRIGIDSGLPTPPTPRGCWWANSCHNAQLRFALKHDIGGIVRAALLKRQLWTAASVVSPP